MKTIPERNGIVQLATPAQSRGMHASSPMTVGTAGSETGQ